MTTDLHAEHLISLTHSFYQYNILSHGKIEIINTLWTFYMKKNSTLSKKLMCHSVFFNFNDQNRKKLSSITASFDSPQSSPMTIHEHCEHHKQI